MSSNHTGHSTETEAPRPCWCCDHAHDPASPGQCHEAACHPACPADHGDRGPFPYEPDTRTAAPRTTINAA